MKKTKGPTPLEHEEQYVAFLKARLESEHWKSVATPEEVALTRQKYETAKFKLKMLREVKR